MHGLDLHHVVPGALAWRCHHILELFLPHRFGEVVQFLTGHVELLSFVKWMVNLTSFLLCLGSDSYPIEVFRCVWIHNGCYFAP